MTIIRNRIGGVSSSLAVKAPVRVASTANISTLSGFQTIDGVALADGDWNLRVLLKDQTDTTENGIYDVSSSTWTRAVDFDGNADFQKGTLVPVAEGSANRGIWKVNSATPTTFAIDTDAISFMRLQTLQSDLINAEDYGILVGDTSANETTNNAALAAITTAIGTGGKRVLFPEGVIRFSTEW